MSGMRQSKRKIKPNKNIKIAVVASKFNEFVSQRLLKACLKELARLGLKESNIPVYWVPGSYEIPLIALKLAKKNEIKAVVCLGAIIRGETFHFELISQGVAQGISQVSLTTQKPIIFGVLTTDTIDQAYKRSKENGDNKGREAAVSALEMINLLSHI